MYPVYNARDSLADEQLRQRQYFVPVAHPELGATLTYPGAPWKLSRTPCDQSSRYTFTISLRLRA